MTAPADSWSHMGKLDFQFQERYARIGKRGSSESEATTSRDAQRNMSLLLGSVESAIATLKTVKDSILRSRDLDGLKNNLESRPD